jgi:hypothetical protein
LTTNRAPDCFGGARNGKPPLQHLLLVMAGPGI